MNTTLTSLIVLCLCLGACMASEDALDPLDVVEPLRAEPMRVAPDDAPHAGASADCTVEEPESDMAVPRARGVTDPHYRAPTSVDEMMAALDVPVTEADLAPLRPGALDQARAR